jgi:hypothetical protein
LPSNFIYVDNKHEALPADHYLPTSAAVASLKKCKEKQKVGFKKNQDFFSLQSIPTFFVAHRSSFETSVPRIEIQFF